MKLFIMNVCTQVWVVTLKKCYRSNDVDSSSNVPYLYQFSELKLSVDSGEVYLHVSNRPTDVVLILLGILFQKA